MRWTIPESALADPLPDAEVAGEMAAAAGRAQDLDPGLDLTVASVAVVDELLARGRLSPADLHLLGAYVGEVLRRAGPAFTWALGPRRPHDPCLALGKQVVDPFALVDRRARGATLAGTVAEVLVYAADPGPGTAARLGWRTAHGATAWDALRDRWQARRRRRARQAVSGSR